MEVIIFFILFITPIIWAYKFYEPRLDVVISPNNKVVLLWYNSWDDLYNYKRTYKKLFVIK